MKKVLLFLFFTSTFFSSLAQEMPDWVRQRPINSLNFTGIGMAKKTDKDYAQKAKKNALGELVSEIKVEVSVNSLLNTIDDGSTIKQAFAESIQTKIKEEIEGFKLIDTWQNNDEYWVYYELNRFDYEEYIENRRQKALKSGFDFWYKGQVYLQQGELLTAIEMFSKGLESINPAINQDLTCSYDNKNINLGNELYSSLTSIFNGVAIVTNPTSVIGSAFKGISAPIAVGVYKNNIPLKDIRLTSEFISGSGDISTLAPTDATGVAALYIRNITSKQLQQEVCISISPDLLKNHQTGINEIILKKISSMLPKAILTINLEPTQINSYIQVEQNDLESLDKSIQSIFTNNYFNIVSSSSEADVIIKLNNNFRTGKKIAGDLYDFVECFSSVSIQIINNRTNVTLLNYAIHDLRTLVSADKSVAQAKSMATRELMKRLQRDLNNELKKITIDTDSDIPQQDTSITSAIPPTIITPPMIIITPPISTKEPDLEKPEKVIPTVPTSESPIIKAELETGRFIEYVKLTEIREFSKIHFKIINETGNDFKLELNLWGKDVFVINEKGEELKVKNVKAGSSSNSHQVSALIVPKLPTEIIIDILKLESIALFSLKDSKG